MKYDDIPEFLQSGGLLPQSWKFISPAGMGNGRRLCAACQPPISSRLSPGVCTYNEG